MDEATGSGSGTDAGNVHRRLLDTIPGGVALLEGGKVVFANAAFTRFVGAKTPEEITGLGLDAVFEPAPYTVVRAVLDAACEGAVTAPPPTIEFRSGSAPVQVEVTAFLLDGRGASAQVLVLPDVTAHMEAEQRLRISELSYRQLFEGAPEAIYVQDENGVFLDVNRHATEMYGHERAFFLGRTPEVLSAPGKNDLQAIGALVAEAFAGTPRRFEFWGLRKDGSIFPKEVMVTPGTYFGKEVVVAFSRDITERRALEAHVLHASRLEAVGRLAGGVAHDFNNILQAINSHVELGLIDIEEQAQAQRHLSAVRDSSKRAATLIRQLLAFARRQVLQKETIDLDLVVTRLLEMLRRLVRESIEIQTITADAPLLLNADPGQVEQVLMNLVLNASDAIEGAGTITIRTGRETMPERIPASRPWATAPEYAVLVVEDTGEGIDPDVAQTLFEPFVTTKEPGKGTGLGLATVHGIVAQHGGGIEVESRPGRGTVIRSYFPLSEAQLPAVDEAESDGVSIPRTIRGGRILLAEDDDAVREVVQEALEIAGYDVVAAEDGRVAMEAFERDPTSLDLAVLDVVMAYVDGRDVFQRIRSVRPTLPVLFSTGYDATAALEGVQKGKNVRTLFKPYPIGDLLDAVEGLLGRAARTDTR